MSITRGPPATSGDGASDASSRVVREVGRVFTKITDDNVSIFSRSPTRVGADGPRAGRVHAVSRRRGANFRVLQPPRSVSADVLFTRTCVPGNSDTPGFSPGPGQQRCWKGSSKRGMPALLLLGTDGDGRVAAELFSVLSSLDVFLASSVNELSLFLDGLLASVKNIQKKRHG